MFLKSRLCVVHLTSLFLWINFFFLFVCLFLGYFLGIQFLSKNIRNIQEHCTELFKEEGKLLFKWWTTQTEPLEIEMAKKGRFGRERKKNMFKKRNRMGMRFFVCDKTQEGIFGSFLVFMCVYMCIKNIHQSHILKS